MTDRMIEVPFALERDADDEGDGLTLEGYAAVFNTPTLIRDLEGEYDEVILPGAFSRTIKARTPHLMFNHGKNPLWANMPIGRITELREDARGLFVRARLSDNWLIHPIRDAIRDGAIDGMSFRFSVPEGKATKTRQENGRNLVKIREVKLMELGPVTSPAYDATTVAVRSLEQVAPEVVHVDTSDALERIAALEAALEAIPTPTVEDETGTSEELVREDTSDEPADTSDPAAPSHSRSTHAERKRVARLVQNDALGIRKD